MNAYWGRFSKRSPLPLRVALILFVMVFGAYVFSACIKQINVQRQPKDMLFTAEKAEIHCNLSEMTPEEVPYVHFPQPKTYSRGECLCTPVRFFVLLSMQRSGSGWFETLLNSHPNISSHGEIFSARERRNNISAILKTLDTVYDLDWFSSAAKNECVAAVGFKWMMNQELVTSTIFDGYMGKALLVDMPLVSLALNWVLDMLKGVMDYPREVLHYFNLKRVSVIFLFRRNLLRRLISVLANDYDRLAKQLNGTHKSHVHTKEEAEVLARFKPMINTEVLISNLSDMEKNISRCLQHFSSTHHMILYYEDIIRSNKAFFHVQEFLNVPVRELVSRQVKIHTRPLSDQVTNWNDVYNKLNGTQYKHFLHHPDYVD